MRDNIAEFIKEKFSKMHREIFRREKKSNNDVISAYWKRKNKEKSHGKVINKAKNTYIYKYSQPAKERKTKKDIKSKWMANG